MEEKKGFFARLGEAFSGSVPARSFHVIRNGPLGHFVGDVAEALGKLRDTGHPESDWQKDKTHVANVQGRGDGVVLANSFRQVSKREPQVPDHDPSIGSFSTRNPYEAHTETPRNPTVARGGFDFGGSIDKLIAAFGAAIGIGTAYAHEPLPAKLAAPVVVAQAGESIDPETGAIIRKYEPEPIVGERLGPSSSRGAPAIDLNTDFTRAGNLTTIELPSVPGPKFSEPRLAPLPVPAPGPR